MNAPEREMRFGAWWDEPRRQIFGPTARDKPAQGKRGTSAALGLIASEMQSPEGAAQLVAPRWGFDVNWMRLPRALPWAGLFAHPWCSFQTHTEVRDALQYWK